ncbi:LTA synthase family protein [Cytobacillus sp. FJAT-54145]|uniref:LTA synthase family protein n=1 Tax=Cytobacillus spartinae TaxID=3299023 RepID=A0ABW6KHN3_9BACI
MSNNQKLAINLPLVAILFLWLKSYIAYKFHFNLRIENFLQELILFINPLSFLVLVLGVGLVLNKKLQKIYTLSISLVISIILYLNAVYYREFHDLITIPLLKQTNNLGSLSSSIFELIHWTDVFFFLDVILLFLLALLKPKKLTLVYLVKKLKFKTLCYFAIGLGFLNLSLAETQRPQLLTRTFDREMLIKNIGAYYFHIYDIFLHTKTVAQRALANGDDLSTIKNYTHARYKQPNPDFFGVGKGKNLIIISMESTQSFVIGKTINGEEITPFLNHFIKESYYFDQFYHQTGQGKTSDSEFLLDNSMYPLGSGAVFFTHVNNSYQTMTKKLVENGYHTASLHANNKSFWNRDLMYKNFGYHEFFSMSNYNISGQNSVGWGMKDIDFFDQSIDYLKELSPPFYTKLITLTNHFPFELNEEDRFIDEFNSGSEVLNRYFPTVRYTDEAIKLFIEDLKKEGLYDDSIIVIYGDHYGISANHNKAMEQFLGEPITRFEEVQLQKVPLIIHIPGMKGETISNISGQIDLRPTLLHLLGITSKRDIQFGTDLFAKDSKDFVVLRDGSFVTEDYLFTKETCFKKDTKEVVNMSHCEPYKEQAVNDLNYSDKIIYGDLLRFSNQDK